MRLLPLTVLATALLCLQSPHASADDKKESKPKSSRTVRHLQTKTVLMNDDNTFDKKNITIDAGMSITWVQNGTKKHNATADDGSWTTGDLTRKGQSVTMQFNQPTGAAPITYRCTHHKAMGMVGTITVTNAETRSPFRFPFTTTSVHAGVAGVAGTTKNLTHSHFSLYLASPPLPPSTRLQNVALAEVLPPACGSGSDCLCCLWCSPFGQVGRQRAVKVQEDP